MEGWDCHIGLVIFFLFWGVSQPFGHCEFQGDLYRGTSFLRHWGYLRDFLRGQNLGDWVFWVPFFGELGWLRILGGGPAFLRLGFLWGTGLSILFFFLRVFVAFNIDGVVFGGRRGACPKVPAPAN